MSKKYGNTLLFIICTLALVFSCYAAADRYVKHRTTQAISDKVLRFHVIASSDDEDDQRRKLLVRDRVGEWMGPKLENVKDRSDCEAIVEQNKIQIKALAEQALAEDGRPETVQVRLADVDFPVKVYGDYEFPAGRYRALQIIIGEGGGHNWWCVMYPNLCFSGESYDVTGDGARKSLEELLTPAEYHALLKRGKYKLGFKYLKALPKL